MEYEKFNEVQEIEIDSLLQFYIRNPVIYNSS